MNTDRPDGDIELWKDLTKDQRDFDLWRSIKIQLTPQQLEEKKIGRNNPCGCGSGNKFKHCCWTGKHTKETK